MADNNVSDDGTLVSSDIPLKQLHTLQGKTFVVIAEAILRKLDLDSDTFVEQVVVDQGILLKVRRFTDFHNG
jgi:hypothetical protein